MKLRHVFTAIVLSYLTVINLFPSFPEGTEILGPNGLSPIGSLKRGFEPEDRPFKENIQSEDFEWSL